MPWVAAIPAIAAVAGGAISAGSAADQKNKSIAAGEKAYAQWLNLHVPDINEQQLKLQQYRQSGQLDPKFEEAVQRGDTNFEKISEDPRLREAQMGALSSLENVAERGGRTLDMAANLAKTRSDVNSQDRARRLAIEQNMAARGGNNSGLALGAQLSNVQSAADRESAAALEASRNAEQNALSSIEKGGNLAGQVRGQDYGIAQNLAGARDSVDAFNANMLAGTRQRNTAAANAAMGTNLSEKQRIADQNVGLSNYEQEKNKGLIQKQYENELQKTSGESNALNTQANNLATQGAASATAANNWLQGGVKAGASAWDAYLKSDKGDGTVKTGTETVVSDDDDKNKYGSYA